MAAITREGYVIGATPSDAEDVNYNNSTSGLEATDVQSGIDELKEIIDSNPGTTYTLSIGTGDDANKIILTPSEGTPDKIIVPYSTTAGDANTVNGKTVAVNVPADAKFTDTNTWRGIQDNLTSSTNTTESLSAKQGYLLANGSARDNTKLPTSGGTLTGALTFANGIWNVVGDDCAIGDINAAGTLGVKGQNGQTCIRLVPQSGSSYQEIKINGSNTMTLTGNVNTTGTLSQNGSNVALKSDISTLQSNFQAGVDSVYNAIVAQGTTPASKSLSDVVNAIGTMSNNRYNSGYSNGYNKGVSDADGRSNPSSYNYQTGYNAGYSAGSGAAKSVPYSISLDGDSSGSHKVNITFGNTKVVDNVRVYYSDDLERSGNITY